jgi:hypothetical protein
MALVVANGGMHLRHASEANGDMHLWRSLWLTVACICGMYLWRASVACI